MSAQKVTKCEKSLHSIQFFAIQPESKNVFSHQVLSSTNLSEIRRKLPNPNEDYFIIVNEKKIATLYDQEANFSIEELETLAMDEGIIRVSMKKPKCGKTVCLSKIFINLR